MRRMNRLIDSTSFKKWCYKISGFSQYGLMRHDTFNETMDEDVAEAVRRLPQHIRDERNFRIVRALQLDVQKRILPKEQWTKFEDDVLYLQPYLIEVKKEREERERWERES